MNTPSMVASGPGSLGHGVAVADVNGDGFGDIVAGAPFDAGLVPYAWSGSVSVYLGSAAGPANTPSQVLISPRSDTNSSYGHSVALLGDWNGDGIDDIVVGEPGYAEKGGAHVYLGSFSGLSGTPSWTATGDKPSCCGYGQRVAGAGDVNGDGFADLLVGNPYYQMSTGKAYLYLGAGTRRPSTRPAWSDVGASRNNFYGDMLSGAGDIDGDGFADVAVSEKGFVGPGGTLGRIRIYRGSSQGPTMNPTWTLPGQDTGVYGWSLDSAGDLNGDGFAEIVVGNNQADVGTPPGTENARGQAFVHPGGAAGPSLTPSLTLTGDIAESWLGDAVATGDVNNDGFDDFIVSAIKRVQTYEQEGRVYLHLGSASGPSAIPAWQVDGGVPFGNLARALAIGDVNGDGFDDAVLGNTDQSRLLLYLGIP